ncbi:2Fe-2S iron-sulfur cluster-binding protein [Mucilaginibacter sp.]|jgi:2Fe-2S ferredoxin|uniref:2Fe-2S iron-sulfur cluster-binding protein n=1 Tax=Mucilaginibacter sp. TaxID=1882438 RepID=UPI002CB06282|nr:2Fe-2S iron-sulfur cluster-binding protein [Mucilaginibacter sp.]HTI59514.1 2Fe-2S iron-sulfur cluster-binding protein [Mucilaginibacter sp.]
MNKQHLPVRDITVLVNYAGEQYKLLTFTNEYRSLMMLIYDNIFTDGFGECLGMGKCGTCLVEIIKMQTEPTAYGRNEEVNLLKAGQSKETIRLACQLLIDEKMDGLEVKILT